MKKLALLLTAFFLLLNNIKAQKVAGFIGDWHPASEVDRIQYDKLTDIYYAFMYTTSTGVTSPATTNGYTKILQPLVTKGHNAGVKVHISLGGANHNSAAIASAVSPANRTNLINNIINTLDTYNLDGFNMDWEFPSASHTTDLGNFMTELRVAMNTLGSSKGKYLELSAAVAPLLWNTDGINQEFIDACDYIEVMAFDAGGNCCVCDAQNHSSQEVAINSIKKWTNDGIPANLATCGGNSSAMNVPIEKIVLAIPFYSNSPKTWASYKNFTGNTPEQYFNDADGVLGSYGYNSKPMIEAKVDLIMNTYKGAGVWCWELADDRDDQYSLLSVMWDAMQPYFCPIPKPDLGPDVSICGQNSLQLNSNATGGGITNYSWKRNGNSIGGSNSIKTISSAGIYEVTVTDGQCEWTDEIEVLGVLPTADLGADFELCDPSVATLDPGVGSGFSYVWKKDNTIITNASSETLDIHTEGTYDVTISATGCNNVSSSVAVTAPNLPSVDDQSRCGNGTVTFSVNSPGSNPYRWYDQLEDGTMLTEANSYTTSSLSQTTNFFVEEFDPTGGICNGKPDWSVSTTYGNSNGFYEVVHNGKLWTNVAWWAQGANYEPGAGASNSNYWSEIGACGATCKRKKVIATIETGCATNQDPTISITTPNNNASVQLPNSVSISANANDNDGSVASVVYVIKNASNQTVATQTGTGGNYSTNWNPTIAGTYSITATVTDDENATDTDQVSITITDAPNQDPTISITNPNNNASVQLPNSVSISANANDNDGSVASVVYVIKNASNQTVATQTGTGGNYSTNWSPTIAGTYTITATVTDNDNATDTDQVSITITDAPNQDPTISITTPNNNASVQLPNSVSISANANDNDGSVASVVYVIKNASNQTVATQTGTGGNYSTNWNPTISGTYTITATVTDNNNATDTDQVSITITDAPNQDPTISITTPNNNASVQLPNSVSISANANDNDGSVASVVYVIKNASNQTVATQTGTGGNHSTNWSPTIAGTYTITATVTDNDNATDTDQVSITITDAPNQDPTISITTPNNNASVQLPNSVSISANANDPDGSIVSVVYTISGNSTQEFLNANNSGGTWNKDWSPTQAGNYTILATVTDNDNATSTDLINFSVLPMPNQNPTISITSPSNNTNEQLPTTINLTANANDPDGSVHTVVYQVRNSGNQVISNLNGTGNNYNASWSPTQTGNYTIIATVTDNLSATETDQISITISTPPNQAPSVSIMDPIQNDIFNLNASVNIKVNASDADGFISSVDYIITNTKSNQAVTLSSTSSPFSVEWLADTKGEFSIKAIAFDNEGSEATSSTILINIQDPLGVGFEESTGLEIYPIPVSNELHVTTIQLSGNYKYEILDLNGTSILSGVLNQSLNVSKLNAGSYVLKVFNETNVVHKVFQKIN